MNIYVLLVTVRSLAVRKMCAESMKERIPTLYLEGHPFKKHMNYLKLSVNETYEYNNISKTLGIFFFPGLFQVFRDEPCRHHAVLHPYQWSDHVITEKQYVSVEFITSLSTHTHTHTHNEGYWPACWPCPVWISRSPVGRSCSPWSPWQY